MNSGTIQASENFTVTNTNMKPTAGQILGDCIKANDQLFKKCSGQAIPLLLEAMEAHANNAVEEKDKRIAELEQGIKKFIHHWRNYFDSPKVGQPPVLSDLESLLNNKD